MSSVTCGCVPPDLARPSKPPRGGLGDRPRCRGTDDPLATGSMKSIVLRFANRQTGSSARTDSYLDAGEPAVMQTKWRDWLFGQDSNLAFVGGAGL